MPASADEIAREVKQLASFSEVAMRIDEVLADETASARDIASLIEKDPAVSAAMLRVANSSAYGLSGTADSVEAALKIIGAREVRDLVYGIAAKDAFKGVENDLISLEDFWTHSLYCGAATQNLAKAAKLCRGESTFTAGLLHDVGHLAMFNVDPAMSREALRLSLETTDGKSTWQAERTVFGFDHTQVGAALARLWNFPATLCAAIEFHHAPFAGPEVHDIAVVVHVANSVAVLAELESKDFEDAPPIEAAALSTLGVSSDTLLQIAETTSTEVADLMRLFFN